MIQIDFDAERLLVGSTGSDPWQASSEVPVRLRIAGLELLGWESWGGIGRAENESRDGISMSALGMARWGSYAIRQARQSGRSVLDLGETGEYGALLLKAVGEDILIHSTPYKKTVQVCYKELLEAWTEFAARVRQFVLREFPGIKDAPYHYDWQAEGWKQWLDGKEDTIKPDVGGWRPYFDRYEPAFEQIDGVEPCE